MLLSTAASIDFFPRWIIACIAKQKMKCAYLSNGNPNRFSKREAMSNVLSSGGRRGMLIVRKMWNLRKVMKASVGESIS
jgi:hypothetical protein